MHRRNFIGAGLASVLGCLLPWRRASGATVVRTFKVTGLDAGELIDLKTWRVRKYRTITLDGEDLRCLSFRCHTGEGWADCLVREPLPADSKPGQLGKVVFDPVTRKPIIVRRYGRLEIR